MGREKNVLLTGMMATLFAVLGPQNASAQETADGSSRSAVLEEVIVTATKMETSSINVPQSISVVTSAEMEMRGVRDIGEAVFYSAGAFAGGTGETTVFGGNSVKLRGFGGQGSAGFSSNEYLDGLKLNGTNYAGSNLDPYLFERVEVLKGPTSVLYGQNQPGGLVNMISKRPTDDKRGKFRIGAGTHDHLNAGLDISGPLTGGLRFRMVGLALQEDLQADHTQRERQAVAPSLNWSNDNTSLTALTNYQHDFVNGTVINVLHADAVFSNPNGRIPSSIRVGEPGYERWDRETWSVGYLFSHSFSNALTFENNLRYTRNELDSRWIFRGALDADRRTITRTSWEADEHANDLAVDSRVTWSFETGAAQHTLLAGFDYMSLSRGSFRRFGTEVADLDLFDPVYYLSVPQPPVWASFDIDEKRQGFYIQDQIEIGALQLVVGGRYDDSTIDNHNLLANTEMQEGDNAFTSRAGIIYNFANGLAPYFSYSESFEPSSGVTFDGEPFEPLRGHQFEAGVKFQPDGTGNLITLAVFDLTLENETTSDPENPFFSIQTGETRTRGVEIEGKTRLGKELTLAGAYTYLDDKITQSNEPDLGNRRAQIPKHNASLWANYALHNGPLSGLDLSLGVRRTGETQGDDLNTFSVPAYTLVDMGLRYSLGESAPGLRGWNLSVNINNLLDDYYVASCLNTATCFIGLSRTVRATVDYNW